MNVYRRAARNQFRTINRLAGTRVAIRRGSQTGDAIPVVPGRTPVDLLSLDEGVDLQARYVDWLFDRNTYDHGGGPVEPKSGDVLVVDDLAADNHGAEYIVTATPADNQVWRYSDEYGRAAIRVHSIMTDDGPEL